MRMLYQNLVPLRGYEAYARAQETAIAGLGLQTEVVFSWLKEPEMKYPDGSEQEMARVDLEVVEKILAVYDRYDLIVIGCGLDSGVDLLWRKYSRRAFGAGEILYRLAAWQKKRFALVIPQRAMIPQYRYLLRRYGTLETFAGFESLELSNQEMIGDVNAVVGRLSKCVSRLNQEAELDEVIMACTLASANLAAKYGVFEIDGVLITDLVTVPIRFCRMLAATGLTQKERPLP